MTYQYTCDLCQEVVDVEKPMKDCDTQELCPNCKIFMRRVYRLNLGKSYNTEKNWQTVDWKGAGKTNPHLDKE